jgi:hypothetical protein
VVGTKNESNVTSSGKGVFFLEGLLLNPFSVFYSLLMK